MMARPAAIIVEVNAVVDGGLDEAQHHGPVVLHRIAIVADLPHIAEINAEAGTDAIDAPRNLMSRE